MSETERAVAEHYATGELLNRVFSALEATGIDPTKATAADLKAGDEFHTGGIEASDHFFSHLTITPDMRVLDVGSGIGGTSRLIADRFGARVTGIDLTPEFVETAQALTERVGLADLASFKVGSALDMPVDSGAYDMAVMMHVGMNIEDKSALMQEVARCLKPGGIFAVFDVMKGTNPDPLEFPLPWSTVPETSFLDRPEVYEEAAKAAGFQKILEHDRTEFAAAFFKKAFAAIEEHGPSPLGIHLMMGDTAPIKFQNYVANLHAARLAPVEMVFQKDT